MKLLTMIEAKEPADGVLSGKGRSMPKAIIVCGGDMDISLIPEKEEGDIIIGADSGCRCLQENGIVPDICIGDWDSLGSIPKGGEVISLNVRKDDTDLVAAARLAAMRGFREFVLLGVLGGKRFSHSVGALQCMHWLMTMGCRSVIRDANCEILSLAAGDEYAFGEERRGSVSVFALSDHISVTMKGLWYEGTDIMIENTFPLGISNGFTGRPSFIRSDEGFGAVILEDDGKCYGCEHCKEGKDS